MNATMVREGQSPDAYVHRGDIVFVPPTPLGRWNEILGQLAAHAQRRVGRPGHLWVVQTDPGQRDHHRVTPTGPAGRAPRPLEYLRDRAGGSVPRRPTS